MNRTQSLFKISWFLFAASVAPSQVLASSTYASIEGGALWQTRNDQAIPGTTGTRFSLSDIDAGPFANYRVYLGHQWRNHEMRALYAPLSIDLSTRLISPVSFLGFIFAPDTPTGAFYKFNSYRLTYTYLLEPRAGWNLGAGFTAKIRDAEVRLTQGALSQSKKNVGFVPLLHLQAIRGLGADWSFRFDFDGLAAPQGRAFDAAFFIEKKNPDSPFTAFWGYRTLEGGADNKEVYNFAWLHYLVLGIRGEY